MGWIEALRSDKAAVVTLAAIAAVLSGLHFGGMPEHYVYVLSAYYFPEIAAADFNLSQSFWSASSVIYALNKVLALQQNEVLVLATAVGVGTAGSVIAHLILRRHFALSAWQAALAVLLLLMVDRKILSSAWPVLMPIHPGSPSMLTNLLSMAVLLLLLEKRIQWAGMTLLALHAFATKENVLLLPSAVLYALACRDLGWRKALWFLLPLAYLAVMALTQTRISAPHDVMLELTRINLDTEGRDGNFLLHGPLPNAMFLASLAATAWLVRPYAAHVRRLVWAFVATAAMLWLVSIAFTAGLWTLLPLPQLVYIGPVRSMRFAVFLFYLVAGARILTAARLRPSERGGLLVGLHGLSPHSVLSTALAVLAVAASMLPRFAADRSARFARLAEGCGSRLPLLPPAVAVAAWVAMQMGFSGYYGWPWDRVALAETGRFSPQLALTALDWRGIAELRADPMYELLAIYKPDRRGYLTSLVLNAHARKAAFNSASFMGFSRAPTLERLTEALKRPVVVDSMLAALNGGRPVSEADRQFMIARKVRLLVPEEAAAAFGSATRAKHGRFVVLELR